MKVGILNKFLCLELDSDLDTSTEPTLFHEKYK